MVNKSISSLKFTNSLKKILNVTNKSDAIKKVEELVEENNRLERELNEHTSKESKIKKFFSTFDAKDFFSSAQVVLLICLALLMAQSFHTWHFFQNISTIGGISNFIFAIITSIFVDGLILFFISRGNKLYSVIAMLCSMAFNVYSYHLNPQGVFVWGTNNIPFSLVASISIPFFLHGVGVELNKIRK